MGTDIRIVPRNGRDILGEGACWSVREQALYWVDILDQRVNRLTADGSIDAWQLPETVGWVIERAGGGLMAGVGHRFGTLSLDPLAFSPIADPAPGRDDHRANDAKADAKGRIWAGIIPIACDAPTGALHRLDPDGTLTCVDQPYTIANGPAIDLAGRWLLHADTDLDTIFRFAINDDGSLGAREPFVVFEPGWGHPDGMTLDAEGGLWSACWGGGALRRFAPDGRLERVVPLPASQITSCAFAGPDLDRLYVTSAATGVDEDAAGALFELEPGVPGLPAQMFGG